jgi:hypothetical protein
VATADPSAGVEPTDAPDPTGAPGSGAGIPTDPALLGTGLVPDGWTVIEDTTAACRIAIPPDWISDILPGTGQPSALAEALASVSADSQDWETYTDNVDQFLLPGHATLIDTEDAFLIATPITADGDLSYLLGLRFDDVNCNVLVIVKRNWIADFGAEAALIAQTLDHTD